MKHKIIIVALALVFAFALIMPALAVGAEGGYDFSRPASAYNTEFDSAEILEAYLNADISEIEAAYLRSNGGLTLSVDMGISTSYIFAEYNDVDGCVTVTAREYVYTSAGGSEIHWIPTFLTFNGESVPLNEENGYTAVFQIEPTDADLYADVEYSFSCDISKEAMNSVLNLAYNDAVAFKNEIDEKTQQYENALAEHNDAVKARADYLELYSIYELELAAFNLYRQEKATWDTAYKNYCDYSAAKLAYDEAVAAMNIYKNETLPDFYAKKALREEYEILYREWQSKLLQKQALEQKQADARLQIAVLDAAFTNMTALNRQIYSALKSGLVDQVVAQREDLIGRPYFASPEAIDMANDATGELRILLEGYKTALTEADKYSYYIINYGDLKDNFIKLAQALDKLYANKKIVGIMDNQGKREKYVILVAQLVTVANGLNGSPVSRFQVESGASAFNSSYKLDGKTVGQILDFSLTAPSTPIPYENVFLLSVEAVEPDYVVDPGDMPLPPPEPIDPGKPYDDPGEPPEPKSEPTEPNFVADPGEPPEEYIPEQYKQQMYDAFKEGFLSNRHLLNRDFRFELNKKVSKKITNVTKYTVTFYGERGELLTAPLIVEEGSVVEYPGRIPEKEEDAEATYRFVGWQDSEGNIFDFTELDSSIDLYPRFEKLYKEYTVEFSVGESLYSRTYRYGQQPVFDGDTGKADDLDYRYSFIGWMRGDDFFALGTALPAVEGDTIYVAQYSRERLYHVTFDVCGQQFTSVYTAGVTPGFDGSTYRENDSLYRYEFIGWRRGSLLVAPGQTLPAVSSSVTYVAEYKASFLFPMGAIGAEVSFADGYMIADCSKNGNSVDLSPLGEYFDTESELEGATLILKWGRITVSRDIIRSLIADGNTLIGIELHKGTPYKYRITLKNGQGGAAPVSYELESVSLSFDGSFAPATTHLYKDVCNADSRVIFTYADNYVSFGAETGVQYILRDDYTVTLRPSYFGGDVLSVVGDSFAAGDTVRVGVSLPDGVRLERMLLYTYGNDAPTEIVGAGGVYSFIMPDGNVSVGVECSYITYTVTFVSQGNVIVSYNCRWGEQVTPPQDPVRAGYRFDGWSAEIVPVCGNAVYEAIFTYQPPEDIPDTPSGDSFADRAFLAVRVCVYMIYFAVIPAVALGVLMFVWELRRRVGRRK